LHGCRAARYTPPSQGEPFNTEQGLTATGGERMGEDAPPRRVVSEGTTVYVACSTLCFGKLSLDETLRVIREMNFPKADLALHEPGPHLRPSEVAAEFNKVAQKLKSANLPFAAFHLDLTETEGPDARTHLRAVCRLARVLAVPLLTVPAAPIGSDFDTDAVRLAEWARIATAEGVMLTVETRSDTLTADPQAAVELCRRVSGLGLTLDPSHYLIGPHGPIGYDPLFPYVRHVRLRDSGRSADQFQVRVGQGEIEYGRIITQLDRFRYERALTVDIRDVADNPFPIEPEVRKLKYLLESLI
jgi:sugar phosphate isomerase/epimerase